MYMKIIFIFYTANPYPKGATIPLPAHANPSKRQIEPLNYVYIHVYMHVHVHMYTYNVGT